MEENRTLRRGGVIDEDVEAAESHLRESDKRAHRLLVAHVGEEESRMPAVGLNQPDGLSTSCFIKFVDDD